MILHYFIKGLLLGFYIAAPLGVISVIYIKRTIKNGRLSGIVSALGVTTSETFYAAAVIYGLSTVSDFLITWKSEIKICGTLFLLYVGIRSFFDEPDWKKNLSQKQSLIADYFSLLFLSAFNPIAIVGFLTVFTTFEAGIFSQHYQALVMLFGFAVASFFYCFCLINIANILAKKNFKSKTEK